MIMGEKGTFSGLVTQKKHPVRIGSVLFQIILIHKTRVEFF